MHYLQAVEFTMISEALVKSTATYQRRECFFDPPFHSRIQPVPYFVILEAIFQTCGRHVRELTGGTRGGIIASLRHFTFSRPLLCHERVDYLSTKAKLDQQSGFFKVAVKVEGEPILHEGLLILRLTESMLGSELNQHHPSDLEQERAYFLQSPQPAGRPYDP